MINSNCIDNSSTHLLMFYRCWMIDTDRMMLWFIIPVVVMMLVCIDVYIELLIDFFLFCSYLFHYYWWHCANFAVHIATMMMMLFSIMGMTFVLFSQWPHEASHIHACITVTIVIPMRAAALQFCFTGELHNQLQCNGAVKFSYLS